MSETQTLLFVKQIKKLVSTITEINCVVEGLVVWLQATRQKPSKQLWVGWKWGEEPFFPYVHMAMS